MKLIYITISKRLTTRTNETQLFFKPPHRSNLLHVNSCLTFNPVEYYMKTKESQIIKCERCGDALNPSKVTWLELSNTDGKFYNEIPAGHKSQGAFSFGRACAVRQLKETNNEA